MRRIAPAGVLAGVLSGLLGVLGAGMPGLAQSPLSPAISPDLSPQDVAAAFEDAVVDICIPAVIEARRPGSLGLGTRIAVATGADARGQSGAEPGDTVWDVAAARGVVLIHEHEGRCVVTAYGPPAAGTLSETAARVTGAGLGFEQLAATPGRSVDLSLLRAGGGKRVQVLLNGSEPGMPGHRSRFSVLKATVFAGQN
ncbi:MAG: hypothetical protein GC155_07740 [Alphaproteobacteria bacterium]|nr:hypothetical protein [Alphaproteobacteria bacterium]